MNIQLVIRQTDSLKFLNLREATASPHPAGSLPLASLARRERTETLLVGVPKGQRDTVEVALFCPQCYQVIYPIPGYSTAYNEKYCAPVPFCPSAIPH